jgi:hypothetical protein
MCELSEFSQNFEVTCGYCKKQYQLLFELKNISSVKSESEYQISIHLSCKNIKYQFGTAYLFQWFYTPDNEIFYRFAFQNDINNSSQLLQYYEMGPTIEGMQMLDKKYLVKYLKLFNNDNLKYEKTLAMIYYEKISHDYKICPKCYRELVERETKMEYGKKCSNCGKTFNEDVNYCTECGGKLKYVKYCEKCKERVLTKFCPKCGEQVLL